MILDKRARANERRRKILSVGGGRQLLLQSVTGITKGDNFIAKCDRTPLSWVTTVVASVLPQCAHAPIPIEKGNWWDWLISVDFWSTQLSLLSDAFRQCWSFSSTKFSCKFRIHSGRSTRTFGFHCFVVLYIYIIWLSVRSKMLGGTFIIYVSNLWMFFL